MSEQIRTNLEKLNQILEKSSHFGQSRNALEERISNINDRIWTLRTFQAWRQNCSKSQLFEKNQDNLLSVRPSDFIADFQNQIPDANEQLQLIEKTDIAEMRKSFPLFELKTADDIFAAQLEFMNIEQVAIDPRPLRIYPFGSSAAQTIGWVGLAQQDDEKLFEDDKFSKYLSGDLSGRQGIEYVCEAILRGRRGEIFYDIDGNISQTQNEFGEDVQLTLDIQLQKKIEDYLTEYKHDPNCGPGISAVVIDAPSGDILAMVSLPSFDLNTARYDYDRLIADKTEPLLNRCVYSLYPPGSSVKPLILIAALESGRITANEIISCPAHKSPSDWPQCWINRQYSSIGHDDQWASSGGNMARNALKGSCNIYFSRLADRIDPNTLQQWLYKFGLGKKILNPPAAVLNGKYNRNFPQSAGIISSSRPDDSAITLEQLPPINPQERRFFGIGQGNLRVTVLQAANAMAAIARDGFYHQPRLFIEKDPNDEPARTELRRSVEPVSLDIQPATLSVIYDGTSAVVNEINGTAYETFRGSNFNAEGVRVYGKTGSTENPDNAWFAGFAKDGSGRSLAVAVVVEGGQHGSSDAAPLARDILKFCIDAGYLGNIKPSQE
jgi:penicillin-binding protein 2